MSCVYRNAVDGGKILGSRLSSEDLIALRGFCVGLYQQVCSIPVYPYVYINEYTLELPVSVILTLICVYIPIPAGMRIGCDPLSGEAHSQPHPHRLGRSQRDEERVQEPMAQAQGGGS